MNLAEKYRPAMLADVVGQDKAVARVELARKLGKRCYWIAGPTGSGKTTIARIIAHEHCGGTEGVTELDSAGEVNAEQLERIDAALSVRFVWGGMERRAWIINEAHYLKTAAVAKLLGILERIERDADGRVLVIFTTTNDGEDKLFGDSIDAGPLLDRCARIKLTNQGLAQVFAERVRSIAQAEGLDGRTVAEYVKLAQRCRNSCRAMLAEVEAGAMMV